MPVSFAQPLLVPKVLTGSNIRITVRKADVQVLPAETSFDEFLRQPEHAGRLRHVVVTDKDHIAGVIRVNTSLRRGLEGSTTGASLGDVASRNFTVVGENDTAFEVIGRGRHTNVDTTLLQSRRQRVDE